MGLYQMINWQNFTILGCYSISYLFFNLSQLKQVIKLVTYTIKVNLFAIIFNKQIQHAIQQLNYTIQLVKNATALLYML